MNWCCLTPADDATHWRNHVLRKIPTPKWQTRESNLPLLPPAANLRTQSV